MSVKTGSTLGRPGASERAYCRPERTTTSFTWAGGENHDKPRVDYWRCQPCGHTRTALADMGDSDGFVRTTVNSKLSVSGTVDYRDERSLDYDDLISEGLELLWQLYTKWKPELGLTFTSYASYYLPLRLVRWWRRRFGVDGNKPLANAYSLDAPIVGDVGASEFTPDSPTSVGGEGHLGAVESRGGDADPGRSLVLGELFLRVDRRALRLGAGHGVRSDADAQG